MLTLTEVDPTLLQTYVHHGSAAWQEDASLLAGMAAHGLRPQGLASRILAVEAVDHDGSQWRVQVVDERAGYSMIDARGAVVQQVEPAGPLRWLVTLVRPAAAATGPNPTDPDPTDPGWRVAAVEPADLGESGAGL